MPIYKYACVHCGFEHEGIYPLSHPKIANCPECEEEDVFVKQITTANFSIRGGNAKNGYYTPPTNEQLGLPSERELKKRLDSPYWAQNTQKGGLVNQQEKEYIDFAKKEEAAIKQVRQKKIDVLSEKHKPEAARIQNAFEKVKKKSRKEREESKKKRRDRGDMGVRPFEKKIIT